VFTILLFYILVVFIFQGLFMTQKFCTKWWCNVLNRTTVFMSQFCIVAVFIFLTIVYCYMVPKWVYIPIL